VATKIENPDPLLDIQTAASYLSVSERWMRRAVQERRLRFTHLGRRLYFRQSWLESYVESQASEAE
jgi:excisionase family DNA binding protein